MDEPANVTNINNALQNGFNGTFQYSLIAHLRHRPELLKTASGKLQIEDFGSPAIQVVWEVLDNYYKIYNDIPTEEAFKAELVGVAKGTTPGAVTVLSEEQYPALGSIHNYIKHFNDFNEEWVKNSLPGYITWVRGTKLYGDHRAGILVGPTGVDQLGHSLQKLQEDVKSMTSRNTQYTLSSYDCRMQDDEKLEVVPTMLTRLDHYLNGGLARRTIGMVAACPGVGKTNTLINFGVAASFRQYRSLIITLEVEGRKMMQRAACMQAGIPGKTMKLPVSQWPPRLAERYDMLLNPAYPAGDLMTISALADEARQINVREIDEEITKWKDTCRRMYGSDEDCTLVCVDWVDLLAGLGFDKHEPDYKRVCTILQELRKLAVKHNVALWTATQAKAEAYNRAIVQMNDIAHGFAKSFPLDVSIGIGLDVQSQLSANFTEEGLDVEDDEEPAVDKHLVFTINKNREGAIGTIKVYQADTLKFFNNEDDALDHRDSLDSMVNLTPLKAFNANRLNGRSEVPQNQIGMIR
jgi:hypothetical protein